MEERKRLAELEAALLARDAEIAARDTLIAQLERQNAQLERQVTELMEKVAALSRQVIELTEKLGRNSSNSHQPPSSDKPGGAASKKKQGKSKSKRRRGGQRGHRGSHRELVPTAQVDEFKDMFPAACENCWEALAATPELNPKCYQSIEVPPLRPHTTEYRRHAVVCRQCGHKTRAAYDATQIPSSPFGPRLSSIIAMLTGVYHVSRRKTSTLLFDLLGVRISLGAVSAVEGRVSELLAPVTDEVDAHIERAIVKHTDGTSWLMAGMTMSLWTIATKTATVYKIVRTGSKAVLKPLFGALKGILVSDRAKALGFWAMERRQICWAHLLRKFVSFSERAGPAGQLGSDLLDYTALLFDYWHAYKNERLDEQTFRAWMRPVQRQLEALLAKAALANFDRVSGSCADILMYRAALWTFVDHKNVEPTNNHAERELRGFVLWRKCSFGTQSERGNRFAERIMTVAHTARKQRKPLLTFLTESCVAWQTGADAPSLFAANSASAA